MKFTFLISLIPIMSNAYVIRDKPVSSIINGVYDYHRTIGIPLAGKIKQYEEQEISSMHRITGGLATEIDAVPYQAGLVVSVRENNSVCGGAIISNTRILTAAHCYSDGASTAEMVTVVLGSSFIFIGGRRIQTKDVVVHSGFDSDAIVNDIAVVKVPSFSFTSQIQPVALPTSEVDMDFIGYQALASGFGMTSNGIPLAGKIKQYEEQEISSMHRITGGLATEIDAVPYQAGLVVSVRENNSVCGGAIISNTRILTAAHCYSDGASTAEMVTVVLGSSFIFIGGRRIQTKDVVVHSGFDSDAIVNDIAVVKVPSFSFTSQIQPVALPTSEVDMDFIGYQALASGFGMTSNEDEISLIQTVSSVTVPVIGNAECMTVYGPYILNQHICTSGAGAKGTCGGDSGGPLVVDVSSRTVLIGITSFGAEICTASFPSAYVRVTHFLGWITSHL